MWGCSVRFMVVRQLVPGGLAQVAPGPVLAGVLAGIELSRLSGYDCVEVLKARYRQFNHERARLMATMVEPDDESHGSADEDSGPDIGDRPDCGDGPEDRGGAAEDGRAADESAQRSPAAAGLELRVRLSTLLGRDQYPAELAGWGPVHAELARDLTSTLGGAQWRFAITDERGQLSYCGITRARPTDTPTRISACRAIVELAVPLATLRALAEQPTELGAWAPVVTDLLDQLARGTADQDRDTHRRSPGTALGRYLEARDRSCIMIGCRAPARTADKDHTRDHGHGGPTTGDNLGAACRHHHRLKHQGGWRLHQPQPGHFHWRGLACDTLSP